MNTIAENIIDDLKRLEKRLNDFISIHSNIKRSIFPGDGFISVNGDYSFERIDSDGIPAQNKLYKDFNQVFDLIEVLLSDSPSKHIKEFKKNRKLLVENILQDKLTWSKTIEEVKIGSSQSFQNVIEIISNLYPISLEKPILIVDTNSLYSNPDIEEWHFTEFKRFEIVVTPSVLKDLDKHKIEHRNEDVRKKAKKIIQKLKEYRRRGKLLDGVTIKKGEIFLRTVAKEPNFEKTLKWLDPLNEDDRLIAELIEIMKTNGGTSVFLVTDDINLQNKCEAADLTFIETPEKK